MKFDMRIVITLLVGALLYVAPVLGAESDQLDKLIRARIDIGEMMTGYFKDRGGMQFGEGGRPSPEQMREMQEDINARLTKVLSSYGLTMEDYRRLSREVLADEQAVKRYLEEHPDLKKRYEALPFDRMGRGGSGRGY